MSGLASLTLIPKRRACSFIFRSPIFRVKYFPHPRDGGGGWIVSGMFGIGRRVS